MKPFKIIKEETLCEWVIDCGDHECHDCPLQEYEREYTYEEAVEIIDAINSSYEKEEYNKKVEELEQYIKWYYITVLEEKEISIDKGIEILKQATAQYLLKNRMFVSGGVLDGNE